MEREALKAEAITLNDVEMLIPLLLTGAAMVARFTRTPKDDELVRRLQMAFADGSLIKGLATVIGVKQ